MMRFTKSAAAACAAVSLCFGEHQIDLSAGGVSSSGFSFKLDGNYRGTVKIGDHLKLKGGSMLRVNQSTDTPYGKMLLAPFLIDADLAALYGSGIHSGAVLLEADVAKNSKAIRFPLPPAVNNPHISDSLTHRDGMGTGVQYGIDAKYLRAECSALYRKGSFNRFGKTDSSFYREGDLYFGGTAHGLLDDGSFFAGASFLGKNDLNTGDGGNWIESALEAGTHLVKNKRKTMVFSRAALTGLQGDLIRENGYTVGVGTDLSCRVIQKVGGSFRLKGDIELEAKKETVKGRFGGSVRKTWDGALLETGYWSTKGALFPRQCGWASGTVSLFGSHLDASSGFKNYWSLKSEHYEYYRTDLLVELTVKPNPESRRITFSGGGLWRNVPGSAITGSGVEMYAGVQSIL